MLFRYCLWLGGVVPAGSTLAPRIFSDSTRLETSPTNPCLLGQNRVRQDSLRRHGAHRRPAHSGAVAIPNLVGSGARELISCSSDEEVAEGRSWRM